MTLTKFSLLPVILKLSSVRANFEVNSEVALPPAGSPRRKPQDNQPAFDLRSAPSSRDLALTSPRLTVWER